MNDENMTNRERLNALDNISYLAELERVFVFNPFREYINYVQWLDSENTDINCCLKTIGEGVLCPSPMEITSYLNSIKKASSKEYDAYLNSHKRKVLLLKKTTLEVLDCDYYVIADLQNEQIIKVPVEQIEEVKLYE